jgi:type I restriction-modification system DNA methylase subunit
MSEEKKQGLTDQPTPPFQNRGLFSDHFLQARLPEWKEWKVDAELVPFQKSLQSLYDSKKPILSYLNEAQTELEFVQPVLDLLGYSNSYIVQAPTKVGQHTNRPDYAMFPDAKTKNMAYQKLEQNDYSLCIGIADAKYWERELDIAKSSDRDTFTNQNPSFQIAAYLTGTKQNWGILTNGRLWRLYSSRSHLPLGNYYQVDLVQLLEEAPIEVLKYFYVLFRKQALLQDEGKSLLDRILEGSEEYAVELEADIKERAYEVVELLCRGFAAAFAHAQLTDAALKSIYDNSLTLLYRLLFVFYAEARELLPLTANASYRENYSLRRLTHEIDETMKKGYELSTSSTQYYHYIGSLFNLINDGDSKLGVPEYNGGLFDLTEHPFLEKRAIPDAYLVRAIHQLARITDKKLGREVAVDYNTLSERHLGSIYEGLLEFRPMIAPHDLVTIKDKGSIKYAPANKHPGKKIVYTKGELFLANDKGERKSSGSYYTPEYIVNYIVENTLDPLVEEAHEKVKALNTEVDKAIAKWQKLKEQKHSLEPIEKYDRKIVEESERLLEPYLSLKVLDPAMGSGHFLARATDFLAEAIATDPDIKSPLELTEESELTYYRRRVVESCIYGVDLNPLAVELAKLTLWLTTMAKSKPLSFLNHHLRVGNSLIGARIADLDEIPKAKGKKKAIDPSRAPVQLGLFQEAFDKKLYDLLQNRALIAKLPTETLTDVHNKQKWEKDFEYKMERFRTLADVWVSTFFGNKVAWDGYNALVENLQSPDPTWEKLLQKKFVQNALDLREHYRFFHWELEFPEVFYDDQGNREVDAGLNAVFGNPPYVNAIELDRTLSPYEKPFWKTKFVSASGAFDLYLLFFELGLSLVAPGRMTALITPNKYLSAPYAFGFRNFIVSQHELLSLYDCSRARVFDDPSVYPIVSTFVRGDGKTKKYLVKITTEESSRSAPVKVATHESVRLKSLPGFLWGFLLSSNFNLVKKIGNKSLPLSEIATVQATSTAAEADKFTEALGETPGPSKKRFINTGLIDSYCSLWGMEPLEHTGKRYLEPYLDTSRDVVSFSRRNLYDQPKLIFAKIALQIEAFGDFQGEYASANTNCAYGGKYNLGYLCAILNSLLLNLVYSEYFGALRMSGGYFQFQAPQLDVLPICVINFDTPEEEREQLFEQAKKLYQEYLGNQNWDKILAFVAEHLHAKEDGTPDIEHEQSDVVHDLLAFLAKEMTRLNEEKQSAIKHFLTWFKKDILKGLIEDQKNKTKIRNFHEGTLEELMDILKKNKVIPDPCPSNIWDTIAAEFSTTMNTLGPLKTRIIMTEKLIDQIVYKLYNLTNGEIAIVEGQSSHKTGA